MFDTSAISGMACAMMVLTSGNSSEASWVSFETQISVTYIVSGSLALPIRY